MLERGAVVLCAVFLGACESILSYPTNESPKPPVPLTAAMNQAHSLQAKYLKATNDQVLAAKLVNFGFLGAGATGIGGALFGGHRDLVTGAAFSGGVLYAGSTLFGSPVQRSSYRTGAQALSCAMTRYAPLVAFEPAQFRKTYDALKAAEPKYRQASLVFEEKINLLAIAGLPDASYGPVNAPITAVNAALNAARAAVEAALAPGASDDLRVAARKAIAAAQVAMGDFNLEAASARAVAEALKSTRELTALTAIAEKLDGMMEQLLVKPEDAESLKYVAANKDVIAGKIAVVNGYDSARRGLTLQILEAHAVKFGARLETLTLRLSEPATQSVRSRAVRLMMDFDKAGTELSTLVDVIHIKVIGELERAEPDRRNILDALNSSTSLSLNYAKLTRDERDAMFARNTHVAAPETSPTAGAVGVAATASSAASLPPRPAAGPAPTKPPVLSAQVKKQVDDLMSAAPNVTNFNVAAQSNNNQGQGMAVAIRALEDARSDLKRTETSFGTAFATIGDVLENISTVEFSNIRTECEQLVNPGVDPLKINTNQVALTETGATNSASIYVYGGTPGYRVQFDKPLTGIKYAPGFDSVSGEYRYIVSADTGFAAGQTYTMTVLDRRDKSAVVTITTK